MCRDWQQLVGKAPTREAADASVVSVHRRNGGIAQHAGCMCLQELQSMLRLPLLQRGRCGPEGRRSAALQDQWTFWVVSR